MEPPSKASRGLPGSSDREGEKSRTASRAIQLFSSTEFSKCKNVSTASWDLSGRCKKSSGEGTPRTEALLGEHDKKCLAARRSLSAFARALGELMLHMTGLQALSKCRAALGGESSGADVRLTGRERGVSAMVKRRIWAARREFEEASQRFAAASVTPLIPRRCPPV